MDIDLALHVIKKKSELKKEINYLLSTYTMPSTDMHAIGNVKSNEERQGRKEE